MHGLGTFKGMLLGAQMRCWLWLLEEISKVLVALSLRDKELTFQGSIMIRFCMVKQMGSLGWFSVFRALISFIVYVKHIVQGSKDQSHKKNLTISTIF